MLEWALKLLLLNVAVFAAYYAATLIFGIPADDMGILGKYGVIIIIVMCNAAFVIYDFCLSAMAGEYAKKYRARLIKIFRFKKK